MERKIGTCGLICTECPSYIATRDNDIVALEALAKVWSKEYKTELTPEDCSCVGCHSTVGPWMTHCAVCEIRACGTEKGVDNCSTCAEYACEKLVAFFGFVPEAKATLDGLRGGL